MGSRLRGKSFLPVAGMTVSNLAKKIKCRRGGIIRTPSNWPAFVFSFASLSPPSHELDAVIPSFQRIWPLS
jgi:hypothetical protein